MLFPREEATPPLPAGRSSSPCRRLITGISSLFFSLFLSLSFIFDLLLWFLSLSHSLISSLAQLLPPLWLFILASVWVVTFLMICGLWSLSECLCAFLSSSLRLYLLAEPFFFFFLDKLFTTTELVVKFWSIFIWLANSASKLQWVWVCDSVVEIIF